MAKERRTGIGKGQSHGRRQEIASNTNHENWQARGRMGFVIGLGHWVETDCGGDGEAALISIRRKR